MTPDSGYTPWLDDGDVRLYHGDALEQLAAMPSESVHCIVTSPPFWGLRDYGTGSWVGGDADCDHDAVLTAKAERIIGGNVGVGRGGQISAAKGREIAKGCECGAVMVDEQIGLEETPDEWCANLVAVMREARRVLRSDGVCWIEVGDTYSGAPVGSFNGGGFKDASAASGGRDLTGHASSGQRDKSKIPGVKPKDLVGAPWLLAFALRADGWYLRSDTIWARPNPMPESVTDRPTKAHSYVFLLTKSARYFYDADAIREPPTDNPGGAAFYARKGTPVPASSYERAALSGRQDGGAASGFTQRVPDFSAGRNARSVWSIATEPTPFAHFATFPQALVERCIKAGTSEHGCCSECGAPWRRITEREDQGYDGSKYGERVVAASGGAKTGGTAASTLGSSNGKLTGKSVTTGWEASCDHDAPVMPCVVLDCFMGSATTALVARRLGRHAVGVELNLEYLQIAAKRLEQLSLLA